MDIPPLCSATVALSTSSLISTLHQTFSHSRYRSLRLDSSSVIILGPNVEDEFVVGIWEHAKRRSEDQALLVLPTHPASSAAFFSSVSAFPNINPSVLQALNVISPFFTALTPANLSTRFHNGLGVSLSLNSNGDIISSRITISESPFTSLDQLLYLPPQKCNRVFDVFYHLLLSESEQHASYLSLKPSLDQYDLLRKSATFQLPDWVQFSDDYALAKDWSDALRHCGFKGASLRGLLSTLSGILLLGNKNDANDIAEGASLIGIDPSVQLKHSTQDIIASAYVSLVQSVVGELNRFLSGFDIISQPQPVHEGHDDPSEIVSVVTIAECSPNHRDSVLRNVFDNSIGINSELKEEGIAISKAPSAVLKSLVKSSSLTPPISGPIKQFRSLVDPSFSYLATPAFSDPDSSFLDVDSLMGNRMWTILNLSPSSDAVGLSQETWSSSVVSSQIRHMFLTEWAAKRRNMDFTADFDYYDFLESFSPLLPPNISVFNVEDWARNDRGYSPTDMACGSSRVFLSEPIWREMVMTLESGSTGSTFPNLNPFQTTAAISDTASATHIYPAETYSFNPFDEAQTNLLGSSESVAKQPAYRHKEIAQGSNGSANDDEEDDDDFGAEDYDDEYYLKKFKQDIEHEAPGRTVEVVPMSSERKVWVWIVWALTFWIPSPILKYIGRMRRSEIRMAWREKLVLCAFILLLNCAIIFYMIFLGRIICPDMDKAWNAMEVGEHQGTDDFYVSISGKVYDITKFYKLQHSDNGIKTSASNMLPFAGLDLSDYFMPPLTIACPGLVSDPALKLSLNTSLTYPTADHTSGSYFVPSNTTALHNYTWYNDIFLPGIGAYYKGSLVASRSDIAAQGNYDSPHYWSIINGDIYDLTNYFYTINLFPPQDSSFYAEYEFLDPTIQSLFFSNPGADITELFEGSNIDASTKSINMQCLNNLFYAGKTDFRHSARCQAANYILLGIAIALSLVTVIKFAASLRFGSSRTPSMQDKFVICQIPAYTEGEEALRMAIDSLTALKYDNRRKLLFVICDGMIVGAGNDRPTPRIVLDIFGVDPKVDPPAVPFHSVGEGSAELNYGKIYSGLYEFEGDVVPFIVVVKVGKPSEKSRPGNRGKRDSQILVMNFLNRVHYQKPMNPLELEIFHHINNVVGVDPELYEYILMVDADTCVSPDSLNRLVASCTSDSKIAGICGETSLQNEEKSWATMIQVYEYYISHHLTKSFESLFGSVTCLPGCFSMYRLRTSKKFKPLIISNEVIRDYSVGNVNTLHTKNLFSLGEDRYLTTLMAKYFPKMKYSFIPDATCQTAAPEEFSVLLSQRRRWINSTVHNLVELLRLDNMCGFCCFGMRGVVFVDLAGTLMLPSVCVYLGYLLYLIISKTGPFPLISVVMIAAVYGLQALVFIIRRQWQHIGWMIIYILAYPIHSFLLPIYSFWNMDNFSWGNTRIVVGEKGGKQLIAIDDDGYDPASVPMETWNSYALRNSLPGAERQIYFDERQGRITHNTYEMTEMMPVNNNRGHVAEMSAMYDDRKTIGSVYEVGINGSRPFSSYSVDVTRNRSPVSASAATLLKDDVIEEKDLGVITEKVKEILVDADLENMTKRQLREKLEDALNLQFTGSMIAQVDNIIDEELDKLD